MSVYGVVLAANLGLPVVLCAADGREPALWQQGVKVSPVLGTEELHSIHAYFNTSPESPDGRWVLLFRSSRRDAHFGDVCVVECGTGRVKVLAASVTVEDVHRVACQQWVSRGRRVVYHDLHNDEWVVVCVEVQTGKQRVLAKGRQVAWGQAHGDVVPLYGPHWDPGEHRDLELLDVGSGEIRTIVTANAVRKEYPDWIGRQFADRPISIFFPVLSPDLRRVFFKIATTAGGGFRSPNGSKRYGIVCCDLDGKLLSMSPRWGHPAWHPDGRRIVNVAGGRPVLIDCETGSVEKNADLPAFPGAHPSVSPDGALFTVDAKLDSTRGVKHKWSVVVGDFRTGKHSVIHRFDNSRGATSWRRSHPHPVFSPDGNRLYFNVSSDAWTRLYVAERTVER